MNALTTTGGGSGMVPTNMDQAMRLAEMMARGKMMPEHLRNPGDALMVIEQAMRWNMSPFAVAQATFNIKGKLLFAGTIVAAAIENSGAITGLMDYQFSGEGAGRKITVSATRRGEDEPRTVEVALKDAKTENRIWQSQPDQQLVYHGARVWARRWTPGVMLGVYSPEEWQQQPDAHDGATIEPEQEPIRRTFSAAPAIEAPKPDKAADGAAALIARINTAMDHAALEAITSDPKVVASRAWCVKNRSGLAAAIDAAVADVLAALDGSEPEPVPADVVAEGVE